MTPWLGLGSPPLYLNLSPFGNLNESISLTFLVTKHDAQIERHPITLEDELMYQFPLFQ